MLSERSFDSLTLYFRVFSVSILKQFVNAYHFSNVILGILFIFTFLHLFLQQHAAVVNIYIRLQDTRTHTLCNTVIDFRF
jgi:hypothetical protein